MRTTTNAARYRWDDIDGDRPLPTVRRRRIIGEQMMISEVLLDAGTIVPTHSHANEQIACIVKGRIKFGLGEPDTPEYEEATLGAGEVMHLPANYLHSAEALEETLVIDLFSPPSPTTGIDVER